MSTQPPPAPESRGRGRNLLILSVYALFAGWRGNVLGVVFQPFVLALGGSVAFLGLLESLGSYRGLIPMAVQPLGGWTADRIGRKGVTIVAGVITAAGLFLLALAGYAKSLPLLVPAIALLGCRSPSTWQARSRPPPSLPGGWRASRRGWRSPQT